MSKFEINTKIRKAWLEVSAFLALKNILDTFLLLSSPLFTAVLCLSFKNCKQAAANPYYEDLYAWMEQCKQASLNALPESQLPDSVLRPHLELDRWFQALYRATNLALWLRDQQARQVMVGSNMPLFTYIQVNLLAAFRTNIIFLQCKPTQSSEVSCCLVI